MSHIPQSFFIQFFQQKNTYKYFPILINLFTSDFGGKPWNGSRVFPYAFLGALKANP